MTPRILLIQQKGRGLSFKAARYRACASPTAPTERIDYS